MISNGDTARTVGNWTMLFAPHAAMEYSAVALMSYTVRKIYRIAWMQRICVTLAGCAMNVLPYAPNAINAITAKSFARTRGAVLAMHAAIFSNAINTVIVVLMSVRTAGSLASHVTPTVAQIAILAVNAASCVMGASISVLRAAIFVRTAMKFAKNAAIFAKNADIA